MHLRILLIEDNLIDVRLFEIMAEYLIKIGFIFEIINENTLEQGIKIAPNYDIVLLDLNLKDSVHNDTILRVHEISESRPVIIYSSIEEISVLQKCMDEGACGILIKKYSEPETVYHLLRMACDLYYYRKLKQKIPGLADLEIEVRDKILKTAKKAIEDFKGGGKK